MTPNRAAVRDAIALIVAGIIEGVTIALTETEQEAD